MDFLYLLFFYGIDVHCNLDSSPSITLGELTLLFLVFKEEAEAIT